VGDEPGAPDRTDPFAHPDLAAAGAAMRAAWRADQEAAARDAHEAHRRRLTLTDRLHLHLHRGDRLAVVVCGTQRFTGTLAEVGPDLIALRTPYGGRVDVQRAPSVPLWFEVVERAPAGGHRGDGAAGGRFHHALARREQDAAVTLGTLHAPDGIDGALAVGADHVVLVAPGGAETVVPIDQVAWVRARRP
jgi:hypothetical protein